MDEEFASHDKNETWKQVRYSDIPKDRKIVGSKWVYKIKRNADGSIERYKARLVAQGHTQQPGLDFDEDETHSPVVRHDSLRLLLAISTQFGWTPQQFDVKTAYLYGKLDEEIYMRIQQSDGTPMYVKLDKCIYGLKQSGFKWYGRLTDTLYRSGFTKTDFDPCVFVHKEDNFYVSIYVDDIVTYGPEGPLLTALKTQLKREFDVSDMGNLHWLLGIEVTINKEGISLSQQAYIEQLMQRFDIKGPSKVSLPIDPNHQLRRSTDEDPRADPSQYQRLIGSLMYCLATRPDLAYPVTLLSQYNADPSLQHMRSAMNLLKYLAGTRDLRLLYKKTTDITLEGHTQGKLIAMEGYTDSDYANCRDTSRSFSGYVFKLAGCTISWKCRKQKNAAHSSAEAEYIAMAMCTKQLLWIKTALDQLRIKVQLPCMFADNQGAIEIAAQHKINERSKHIRVAYHITRERLEEGDFQLVHVPSEHNLADICTKGLRKPLLLPLRTAVMGA